MRYFIALCAVIFLLSCEEKPKPPKGIIEDELMVQLLADMHLLETAQNSKLLISDSVKFTYEQLYAEIFSKHGVTNERYDSTMMWLSVNPEKMEKIYDRVIEELSERESKVR